MNKFLVAAAICLFADLSWSSNPSRDYLVQFANNIQDVSSKRVETIRVVAESSSPMACLQIAFKHGGVAYDGDHYGIAMFMAKVFEKGYIGIANSDYKKLLDERGVSISYDVDMDNMIVSIYSLPEELEFAVKTLSTVLSKPKLDNSTVSEVQNEIIADLQYRASNDPESLARDALHKKLFFGHPYGNSPDGTIESVKKIDSEAVSERIKRTIVSGDVVAVAAGNVSIAKIPDLVDKIFSGAIPIASDDQYIDVVDIKPALTSDITQVTAGSGKAVVEFAQKAYYLTDAKYPAYLVLTTWLGRPDLDSLLMRSAREVGLSYRTGVQSVQYKHSAFSQGFAIVESRKEEPMIHLMSDAIATAASKGPNYSQVESAKAYELSKLAFALVSCNDRASFLMKLLLQDLNVSDVLIRYDAISGVTESDVLGVAKELFDSNRMSIVVVS